MSSVSNATVLEMPDACEVRRQEEQVLVYNRRTDEMHLVPPSGYYVIRLCNGLRSVGEIEEMLEEASGETSSAIHKRLYQFLRAMVERGILEQVRKPSSAGVSAVLETPLFESVKTSR